MNFFQNIKNKFKERIEDLNEKKEFLQLVNDQTLPIRRQAYLEQKKKDAIAEGIALAKKDSEKIKGREKKTAMDFGLNDPYKFIGKQENQTPDLTPPKTNLTKLEKEK